MRNAHLKRFLFLLVFFIVSHFGYAQNKAIEKSGDVIQIVLPAVAFSSTFIWNDDTKPALQFVKTMGISVLVTHGLKRLVNKTRPNGGKYSFPSGHTAAAFTGAAFISKRYGWKVGIPSYLLASYVGWTRVKTKHHDYWDVLGGAVIGIGSAYLFVKPYRKKTTQISFLKYQTNGFVVRVKHVF